jgi:hypothetical protein
MTTTTEVVSAARDLVGLPWRHQGRDHRGLDCYGVIDAVCKRLAIAHPQVEAYPLLPPLDLFDQLLRDYAIEITSPVPGCLSRFMVGRRPQHMAIVAAYPDGELTLIHSAMHFGGVCEHRFDARWRRRLVSSWMIRGVA